MRRVKTKQEDVPFVASKWKDQYCGLDGRWTSTFRGDAEDIYKKLVALPATATPADVAAIIGNDGWTGEAKCDECGGDSVVMLGQEPDYESATVYLCEGCLKRAMALVQEAHGTTR